MLQTRFPPGVPMVLTSSTALTTSQTQQPDIGRLTVPFDGPMLVEQINFTLYPPAGVSGLYGALVDMRLVLDGRELTNGFVPVITPCPCIDSANEVPTDTSALVVNGNTQVSFLRWRLAKPLFLRPGQAIIPTFSRGSTGNSGSVYVNTGILGRMLPKGTPHPGAVALPWIAGMRFVGATPVTAAEATFKNTLDKELFVQRLTGRLYNQSTFGEVVNNTTVLAKIAGPSGRDVVSKDQIFADVFQINSRAWDIDATLKPNDIYNITISPTASISAVVGMIGYREEVL